jgi:hypothetical protein
MMRMNSLRLSFVKGEPKMRNQKKSKEERKRDRKIVERYHQKVTEDALEPLYLNIQKWKDGKLPELTKKFMNSIKQTNKYWSMFNYNVWNDEFLILVPDPRCVNALTHWGSGTSSQFLDIT